MRINLNVPYSERQVAKDLGANWDITEKVWFVEDDVNLTLFAKWFPSKIIRSHCYSIIEGHESCWKCEKITSIYGLLLSAGFERWELGEEDTEIYLNWTSYDRLATIFYLTDLASHVIARLKAISKYYYLDFSQTTKSHYWMNHCEYCGAKQGDFMLYCEPGAIFYPDNGIVFSDSEITYHEPFSASGDIGSGDHFTFFTF